MTFFVSPLPAWPGHGYRLPVILLAPTAVADVLDRLTILTIKAERVPPDKRIFVDEERSRLATTWSDAGLDAPDAAPEWKALLEVNTALWEVEDRLRACEAAGRFDGSFVADARSVYRLNDRRAALKRAVNERLGSALREIKHHPGYV